MTIGTPSGNGYGFFGPFTATSVSELKFKIKINNSGSTTNSIVVNQFELS